MTFPMLRERATNYATRPFSSLKFLGILSRLIWIAFSISKLIFESIDIILTILIAGFGYFE